MKTEKQMISELYAFFEKKYCTCQQPLAVGIRDGIRITRRVCQFHNTDEYEGLDGEPGALIPVDKVLP